MPRGDVTHQGVLDQTERELRSSTGFIFVPWGTFEVLKFDMERVSLECCWRRWREWIARKNDLHGGFKMGHCRESRCRFTCSGCFGNPGEMEMEHLDTTFSPSSQEHQKALYLGVKLPAEEKETAQKDPQNDGKKPCAPFTLRSGRRRSRGFGCEWNAGRATRPQYGVNFREKLSAKYVVFHSRTCARPWRG